MRNMTKALVAMLALVGLSKAADYPLKMGVPANATARSVKVCAVYPHGMACGTGSFIGKGKILTETHIVGQQVGISGEGILREDPLKTMVLKYDEQTFQPAVLISSHVSKDLALLEIEDKTNPQVIFSQDEFLRGDEVFVIGNPGSEDFKVVKTKIVGVMLFKDREQVRSMIMVDSKKGEVRPGFSGGGIYNKNGGLLGIIEVCNEDDGVCAGISGNDVQRYLTEVK